MTQIEVKCKCPQCHEEKYIVEQTIADVDTAVESWYEDIGGKLCPLGYGDTDVFYEDAERKSYEYRCTNCSSQFNQPVKKNG